MPLNSQDRDSNGLLVPKGLRDEWLCDQVCLHRSGGYPREVAEQKALQDWRAVRSPK
jgi:hypothetical protein